jgi:hypothetical protein
MQWFIIDIIDLIDSIDLIDIINSIVVILKNLYIFDRSRWDNMGLLGLFSFLF